MAHSGQKNSSLSSCRPHESFFSPTTQVFNVPVVGHAQSLLKDVKNRRLKAKKIHRPLIFVAHSLKILTFYETRMMNVKVGKRKVFSTGSSSGPS
jgi:hypothetical protein